MKLLTILFIHRLGFRWKGFIMLGEALTVPTRYRTLDIRFGYWIIVILLYRMKR